MGDMDYGETLATPPLDPDFFSDLFSDDIDFSSDDFSLFDLLNPDQFDPSDNKPLDHPIPSDHVPALFADNVVTDDLAGLFPNSTVSDDVVGSGDVLLLSGDSGPGDYSDVAGYVNKTSDTRVSADAADYMNVSSDYRVSDVVAGNMNSSSNTRVCDDVVGDMNPLFPEDNYRVYADVEGNMNISADYRVSDDVAGYVNSSSDSRVSADVAGFLNMSTPENSRVFAEVASSGHVSLSVENDSKVFADVAGYPSPGNSGNSVNFVVSNNSPNSVLSNDSSKGFLKSEEESNNSALKRKKNEVSEISEIRTSKHRRGNFEDQTVISNSGEEKKKARLERNRESAQLSRQRKKHYVEELEDKVRAMQSTIHDLNSRISYVMAENNTLRMQANGAPPPGMYPPVGYPWAPYPPYMVKGSSQVLPIPRLKPQKVKSLPKVNKSESKSKSKTKKVASVSFLGLLFFVLLFGGLLPMVNLKFSEMDKSFSGNEQFLSSVNGSLQDLKIGVSNDFKRNGEFGNSSEPLFASLYVPRNDKLVKIDGNLIIQSVMASEKAMGSRRRSEETSLAVSHSNVPNVIPLSGRTRYPHPYRGERQRALGGEKDKMISSAVDGNSKLQEWFIDGLAGPMLSSGMCTEVFQFDVSPGAIVPATTFTNVSSESQHLKNVTTKHVKGNRRILHGAPIPLESNITEKPVGIDSEKDKLHGNSSLSSMVVSVLVDPREVGDGGGDGIMGPKSLSRIFVVVLIDSVKYVTYSCMLPLRGSSAHLVTT